MELAAILPQLNLKVGVLLPICPSSLQIGVLALSRSLDLLSWPAPPEPWTRWNTWDGGTQGLGTPSYLRSPATSSYPRKSLHPCSYAPMQPTGVCAAPFGGAKEPLLR